MTSIFGWYALCFITYCTWYHLINQALVHCLVHSGIAWITDVKDVNRARQGIRAPVGNQAWLARKSSNWMDINSTIKPWLITARHPSNKQQLSPQVLRAPGTTWDQCLHEHRRERPHDLWCQQISWGFQGHRMGKPGFFHDLWWWMRVWMGNLMMI